MVVLPWSLFSLKVSAMGLLPKYPWLYNFFPSWVRPPEDYDLPQPQPVRSPSTIRDEENPEERGDAARVPSQTQASGTVEVGLGVQN